MRTEIMYNKEKSNRKGIFIYEKLRRAYAHYKPPLALRNGYSGKRGI